MKDDDSELEGMELVAPGELVCVSLDSEVVIPDEVISEDVAPEDAVSDGPELVLVKSLVTMFADCSDDDSDAELLSGNELDAWLVASLLPLLVS